MSFDGLTETYSPRDFITAPFRPCGECGRQELGHLWIHGSRWDQSCRACGAMRRTTLPPTTKTLIYVDQFAISEMMKALNPETRAHAQGRVNPIWLRTFEALDRASKLQLVVCPESPSHESESAASPFYEGLRRLYELLSGGVTFFDHATITRSQITEHAQHWVAGRPDHPFHLDPSRVLSGSPNDWTDMLRISVKYLLTDADVDEARSERDSGHDLLVNLFETWREMPHLSFEDWFQREADSVGESAWAALLRHSARLQDIQSGAREPTLEDFLPTPATEIALDVARAFKTAGLSEEDVIQKLPEFLMSPSLRRVPSIRIQGLLFGSLAHQAANGRKRPPGRGTFTDVRTIATVLPYCDAIIIDNEMRDILTSPQVRSRLDLKARLYSRRNLEEFLVYLETIEGQASAEHLRLVEEVYGEIRPFTRMFHVGREELG